MKASEYVANFNSTTAMLRATRGGRLSHAGFVGITEGESPTGGASRVGYHTELKKLRPHYPVRWSRAPYSPTGSPARKARRALSNSRGRSNMGL